LADAEIGKLSDAELDELERLLEESDPHLYAASRRQVMPADGHRRMFVHQGITDYGGNYR